MFIRLEDKYFLLTTDLLQEVRSTDISVLVGDFNAKVGRLGTEWSGLGGQCGFVGCRTDNRDHLLQQCTDHNLILTSTNVRHVPLISTGFLQAPYNSS